MKFIKKMKQKRKDALSKKMLDAAWNKDYNSAIKYIKKGADINYCEFMGYTCLFMVLRKYDEVTDDIISKGTTPANDAADYLCIIKFLIDNGADLKLVDENFISVLTYSGQTLKPELIQLLLTAPNLEKDLKSETLLKMMVQVSACFRYKDDPAFNYEGFKKIILLLLQSGADPNYQNRYINGTALMYAIEINLDEVVEYLLSFNANSCIQEHYGYDWHGKNKISALQIAINKYRSLDQEKKVTEHQSIIKIYNLLVANDKTLSEKKECFDTIHQNITTLRQLRKSGNNLLNSLPDELLVEIASETSTVGFNKKTRLCIASTLFYQQKQINKKLPEETVSKMKTAFLHQNP